MYNTQCSKDVAAAAAAGTSAIDKHARRRFLRSPSSLENAVFFVYPLAIRNNIACVHYTLHDVIKAKKKKIKQTNKTLNIC